jgi:hypothetical protein
MTSFTKKTAVAAAVVSTAVILPAILSSNFPEETEAHLIKKQSTEQPTGSSPKLLKATSGVALPGPESATNPACATDPALCKKAHTKNVEAYCVAHPSMMNQNWKVKIAMHREPFC